MENTLENKAKFFAQYWGQLIIGDVNNAGEKVIYPVEKSNMYRFEETRLELKPISSITDEDAIEVAKIVLNYYKSDKTIEIPINSKFVVNKIHKDIDVWFRDLLINIHTTTSTTSFVIDNKEFLSSPIDVYDYLRSKGYALPWMGLTVEQLIEYGWIKLK